MTLSQANADLSRVEQTLQKDYPNDYIDYAAALKEPPVVFPYIELLVGTETKPALLMTLAACGFLLVDRLCQSGESIAGTQHSTTE